MSKFILGYVAALLVSNIAQIYIDYRTDIWFKTHSKNIGFPIEGDVAVAYFIANPIWEIEELVNE